MFTNKLFPLSLVAIEYVQVHMSLDAFHIAVGAELPQRQMDVGFVLAIARNPEMIVFLQVWGIVQPSVDKALVDIQQWTDAQSSLYNLQEGADILEEYLRTAHLLDHGITGFYVEHWGQVATLKTGMSQEMIGLGCGILAGGEEMIGSNGNLVEMTTPIVVRVIAIQD